MLININKTNIDFDFKTNKVESEIELKINNSTTQSTNKSVNFNYNKLGNKIIINDNGINKEIFIAQKDNKYYVYYNGNNYYFDEIEEVHNFGEKSSNNLDEDNLKSPMPGNIIKILVEINQIIKEGDPILIIEAMKMETTLFASIDGIVNEINVKEKEQVDTDLILVKIIKE